MPDLHGGVEQEEGDEDAYGEIGDELYQRLEGDGQHHARMTLGHVDGPHPKDYGETGEDQADHQAQLPGGEQMVLPQDLIGVDDRLLLQRDVGQGAKQGDEGDHHRK